MSGKIASPRHSTTQRCANTTFHPEHHWDPVGTDAAHPSGVRWLCPGRKPSYVYVASSWRNPYQPAIVKALRSQGIDCYDFREPEPGVTGFAWSDIDPDWQVWSAVDYRCALDTQIAVDGYGRDMEAMRRADTFVLVQPCGRSAHLELGWAVGKGKHTCILTRDGEEPELMAKMVDHIAVSEADLLTWLGVAAPVPSFTAEVTR